MGPKRTVALAAAGFAFLLIAWIFSSAPFRGPDEGAHYLRALDISEGRLLGPKEPYTGATPWMTAWVQHDNRGVFVPALLSPPHVPCVSGKPNVGRRGCFEPSYTADYQPLPYLLAAAGIAASHSVTTGLWLARLGAAMPCLMFLSLAFALLWEGSVWSILGLFAAITPMTLFTASVVNPSGLAITADLAFVAGLLRISRHPQVVPRYVWVALAAGGTATVLAYQLGWVYVLAEVAVLSFSVERASLQRLASNQAREVLWTVGAMVVAGAIYLVYGIWSGVIHGTLNIHPLGLNLYSGYQQLINVLPDAVGNFGPLTVPLPRASQWIWLLLVVMMWAGALAVSRSRGRLTMLLSTLMAASFPILFFAWVYRLSGFPLQARYAMPVLALVPLVAGELIYCARERFPRTADVVPGMLLAFMASFQLYAWWINARESASRLAPYWFLGNPQWSPPLGWIPWTAAAVFGVGAILIIAGRDMLAARATGGGARPIVGTLAGTS